MTDAMGFDIETDREDDLYDPMIMPSNLTGANEADPCIGCGDNDGGFCRKVGKWCHAAKLRCKAKPMELKPTHKGRTPKRVVRLTDGKVYQSAKEAGAEHGVSEEAICSCCKGDTVTSAGHQWEFEGSGRGIIKHRIVDRRKYPTKAVRHLPTGNVYPSALEAGKAHGHAMQTVYLHLCGKIRDIKYEYA